MTAKKWPGYEVKIGLKTAGEVTDTWIFYDPDPRARAEKELERRGMTETHTIITITALEPGN